VRKILIVDDQPCVQQLLTAELTLEGYYVASSGDAGSARRLLSSLRPDVVILDLHLGGPDGFDFFEDIKRKYPDLPVIILTAYDSYRDDPRLSQADGYVVKSMALDELKGKIADVLSRKPAPEALGVKTQSSLFREAYG
jgi:two-component system response regulator (stage 0 sporulation protein F)